VRFWTWWSALPRYKKHIMKLTMCFQIAC